MRPQIKKVLLPKLRGMVAPDDVVSSWEKPPESDGSTAALHAAAQRALGPEDAKPFVAAFSRDLRALAASDLEAAAAEQGKARAALALLVEMPVAEQTRKLTQ
eukprot:4461515-Prymnesium_polylepis.1